MQRSSPSLRLPSPLLGCILACAQAAGCSSAGDGDKADGGGGTSGTAGASGSATGGSATGGSATGGSGGGATVERAGFFTIEFVLESDTGTPAYTSVGGRIYDALVPPDRYWNLASEASGCSLYTPRPVLCDPACSASESCVLVASTPTCAPQPGAYNAGTLSVTGLRTSDGTTTFALEPTVSIDGSIVTYQSPTLPERAADEGAPVRIETSPGAAFALEATAVLPLDLAEGTVTVAPGESVPLTWVPGASSSARIQIKLDISHHGGSRGKIECDVPDTGSLEIPAALITELVALGVAGYPTIQVARATTDRESIAAGPLELLVFSGAERPVIVPGVTSCMSDEECPVGESCDFSRYACTAL